MTDTQKDWIDGASYYTLLDRWRNAPIGDSMFSGDTGKYYGIAMKKAKDKLLPGEQVAISKAIGHESGLI
jgi:hypothetical protein